MDDLEVTAFLQERIDQRAEVLVETHISDDDFQTYLDSYDGDLLREIEEDLFNDNSHQIGHGTTARVHSLETDSDQIGSIAVKYLISPNTKTIGAAHEENILKEVERLHAIEEMESEFNAATTKIRVPHTFFHHRTQKVACYGMQQILGPNLESGALGVISDELMESLEKKWI
jgi:isocitrate/isopropylmalate dehydrogenase